MTSIIKGGQNYDILHHLEKFGRNFTRNGASYNW